MARKRKPAPSSKRPTSRKASPNPPGKPRSKAAAASKSRTPTSRKPAPAKRPPTASAARGRVAAASAFPAAFAKATKQQRAQLARDRKALAKSNAAQRKAFAEQIQIAQARAAEATRRAAAAVTKASKAAAKSKAAKDAAARAKRVAASAIARASKTNRRPRDRLATQDRRSVKDRISNVLLPLAERKMQRIRTDKGREKFQQRLEGAIKLLIEKAAKGRRALTYHEYKKITALFIELGFDGPTISQLYGSEPA